jgi:hypothetical protein
MQGTWGVYSRRGGTAQRTQGDRSVVAAAGSAADSSAEAAAGRPAELAGEEF